jgi:RNA polymerase sigma-70 factor (ECF subfamily)
MARLAEGERDAFAFVFGRLWPVLRRFARRAFASQADADDVAQRALLSIMARASEYDAGRDALAWAIGITMWECRSAIRRRDRRRESPVPADLVATSLSPEAVVIEQDLRRAIEEALGSLDASDLAALGLSAPTDDHAPQGLVGGAPAATLRKRRQRALTRLRAVWSRLHAR